jgi:hypothetical protein
MIRIGLSSQALLTRSTADIIAAARKCGAEAMEWAGGVHIPHGDPKAAEGVMIETLRAGLTTASYSAIYLHESDASPDARIDSIFKAADILQAPLVRIFLGGHSASRLDPERRAHLVAEARRLGDRAGLHGRTLCLSMSRHSSLDRYPDAIALAAEIDHPFVRLAWDALPGLKSDEASGALEDAGARVAMLVARHVEVDGVAGSLAGEEDIWRRRLSAFKRTEIDPKMGLFVFIGALSDGDFAPGEPPPGLAADVALLRRLADEVEAAKA